MSNKTEILKALRDGVPIAELEKIYAKGSIYKWRKLWLWQKARARLDYLIDTGEWQDFSIPEVKDVLEVMGDKKWK